MIKAVIFDMDGVISDTLGFHARAESKVLTSYGIKMTPRQIIREFNAVPDPVMFKAIFSRFNTYADIGKVIDEKWKIMQKFLKKNVNAIPGSLEFINLLHKNSIILGLASSTPMEFIEFITKTFNVKEKFKAFTSTAEVKHGKPSPDRFLLTAKKLGMKPQECLVMEDAVNGIVAAQRANMKCIAITTTHKKEELQGADRVIKSFKEIALEDLKNL